MPKPHMVDLFRMKESHWSNPRTPQINETPQSKELENVTKTLIYITNDHVVAHFFWFIEKTVCTDLLWASYISITCLKYEWNHLGPFEVGYLLFFTNIRKWWISAFQNVYNISWTFQNTFFSELPENQTWKCSNDKDCLRIEVSQREFEMKKCYLLIVLYSFVVL